MPEPSTRSWIEQVANEHQRLNAMVADLRDFLDIPRPELGQRGAHTWASELSGRLVKLHDELFRHFRYEEEGGMVEELETAHPRCTGEVEQLVDEHGGMLGEIRALMQATLAYSEGVDSEEQALRRRVTALLEWLSEHERAENDLILRLATHDLGLGD